MDEIDARAIELEGETLTKVSDSLSKIEVALSDWDSAKRKPKALAPRIIFLRFAHKQLSAWAAASLKGKRDLASRARRFQDFISLCRKLEAGEAAAGTKGGGNG